VATGTWSIDLHYPKGYDFRTYAEFKKVKPYPIPFRCLYSKDIENLMMAGRNMSETHVALGSTRVMNTGGQMGVAVGAAAYLCKKHDTTPRGVYEKHLEELLEVLKTQRAAAAPAGPPGVPPAPSGMKVLVLGPSATRCSDEGTVTDVSPALAGLPYVTINRGPMNAPAPAYAFEIDKPATVYIAVHDRGQAPLPEGWEKTDLRIRWTKGPAPAGKAPAAFTDTVYRRNFPAGRVEVPGHAGTDGRYYGLPNLAIVGDKTVNIKPLEPKP
jgi:hypothetical protein